MANYLSNDDIARIGVKYGSDTVKKAGGDAVYLNTFVNDIIF